MRHRKYTFKIGRTSSHRRAMLANAVCSLIQSGRIITTVTKAKEVRRLAERMVTLGKQGTLASRRRAVSILHQRDTVAHLFREVAPRFEKRIGGYTRIVRMNRRIGDAADMCILEFLSDVAATAAPTEGQPPHAAEATGGAAPATTDAKAEGAKTEEKPKS